jgi:Cellulose binding domain
MQKPAVPRRPDGVELEAQMRRFVGVLVAVAAIASGVIGGTAAAASTTLAAACTGTVQVAGFSFDPSRVSPGGRSVATLTVQNCTSTAVSVSATWFGRFTAPGVTGIPAGCPAIDPIVQQSNIAPNGTATQSLGFSTFAQCTAAELDAVVNLSAGGTTVGSFTAPLTIVQPACTGSVKVTSFTFEPSTVIAGANATATLVLQNCTSTAVAVQGIWAGHYTAPGVNGIPPGCTAIDPLAQQVNVPPNGTASQTLTYSTFAATLSQCAATGLDATVSLSSGGTALGTATAHLTIQRNVTPTCRVQYAMNVWPGGFVANVTISNTGTTTVNGWTLTFTLPAGQTATGSGWGVSGIRPDGQAVTLTNASWDASIIPGASVSAGFQGTWTTSSQAPTAFTLNGAPCAT